MKPSYEELEAQVKQLAAENAGLKSAVKDITDSAEEAEYDGYFTFVVNPDTVHVGVDLIEGETPATEDFLSQLRNEAQAEGVEMFVSRLQQFIDEGDFVGTDEIGAVSGAVDCGKDLARQLREGKVREVKNG